VAASAFFGEFRFHKEDGAIADPWLFFADMKRVKQKGGSNGQAGRRRGADNYSVDSFPPIVIKRMESQGT
jgi:hypothetical protein